MLPLSTIPLVSADHQALAPILGSLPEFMLQAKP
ncbi:hypothetical protein PP1Y_Lpl1537 (plasmid) [Novosphingobium sp. PP1Y]|nr:hypothetical protein PP1Y_Lpl1537 [Novosphingobium sp. PP1Y]